MLRPYLSGALTHNQNRMGIVLERYMYNLHIHVPHFKTHGLVLIPE